MKKLSYKTIILAAACLLLPGCSDDAADAIEQPVTPPTAELVGDSEVEIKLSSSSSTMTRAGGLYEERDENGELTGKFSTLSWRRLGVFCLATGKQPEATTAPTPVWSNSEDKLNVLMWNQHAQVNVEDGGVALDNTKPYFYPANNMYRYSFYAYHMSNASLATPVLSDDGNQILIQKQNIDGREDVIWGKAGYDYNMLASDEHLPYAYSAKYFRQKGAEADNFLPNIQLEHILSRFTFSVVVGDEGARNMRITSVGLADMPTKFDMVLADNTQPEKEGGISKVYLNEEEPGEDGEVETKSLLSEFLLYGRRVYKTADGYDEQFTSNRLAMTIPSDAEVNSVYPFTNEYGTFGTNASIGDNTFVQSEEPCIMVIPGLENILGPDGNKLGYKLRIVMRDAQSNSFESIQALPVPTAGFERGKTYNVKITVYGPQQIKLTATMKDWIEGDDISVEL